jgi:hypothetical protein
VALLSSPALAVMQVVPMTDPNAPVSSRAMPPDGLFDHSMPDQWQKKSDNGQQGSQFHFSVGGGNGNSYFGQNGTTGLHFTGSATTATSTFNPSALDDAKQPNSEFYQPMPGSAYPIYNH